VAIGVFVIEREFMKAAAFALAGAVLRFFGFMHGESIGIAHSPGVAVGYLLVAGLFAGCALGGVERKSGTDHDYKTVNA
jgi:adenine/guanine/hypoxanthine permease